MSNRNRDISDLVSKWLSDRPITQTEFAEKLGISQSFLSRQLKGASIIPVARLKKIVEILSPGKDEVAKLNALLYAKNDEDPAGLRQVALDLCHKTLDSIGPDAMLLQVLMNWCGFNSGQKIEAVSSIIKIAEKPTKEEPKP